MKDIFIGRDLISNNKFDLIQERVDGCIVPPDIGRILHKIHSSFGSFTADQWKNWVVYFSTIVLHDMLTEEVMECWRHFVLACRLLILKSITVDELKLADALILQFCRRSERLFGTSSITPNMHMHCHLKSCIEDYGPSHVFWLYAFERYNGILGSMPNNNKCIETQLMRRFLEESHFFSAELPSEFSDQFQNIISSSKNSCSLLQVEGENNWTLSSPIHHLSVPDCYSRHTFSMLEKDSLFQLYSKLYNTQTNNIEISSLYMKYNHASMFGKQLGSFQTRTASSSLVFVSLKQVDASQNLRLARINNFCKHSVQINGHHKAHLLINVAWFKSHPKKDAYGKPVTIWYHDLYEDFITIVPVQFVKSRSVSLVNKLDGESVLFAVPVLDF